MSSCQSIVVCSNLMHYCGVNFTSLQNWCDCLIANYGSSCRDETLVNYFTFIFSTFLICLVFSLCCILCRGVVKLNKISHAPPKYSENLSEEEKDALL